MLLLPRSLRNFLLKRKIECVDKPHAESKQQFSLYETWLSKSQPAELEYHIHSEWRHSGDFWPQTQELFAAFGFKPDTYVGKTILDLGAGSQLRTKYFRNCTLIALEPLADSFLKNVDNCDLLQADRIISAPAETLQNDLIGNIDFCISINVLDHCYDFETICRNIFLYLKDGGSAFLSFDEHDGEADPLHPLALNCHACSALLTTIGFRIDKITQGFPEPFKTDRHVNTYGHGAHCCNFWLTKP